MTHGEAAPILVIVVLAGLFIESVAAFETCQEGSPFAGEN